MGGIGTSTVQALLLLRWIHRARMFCLLPTRRNLTPMTTCGLRPVTRPHWAIQRQRAHLGIPTATGMSRFPVTHTAHSTLRGGEAAFTPGLSAARTPTMLACASTMGDETRTGLRSLRIARRSCTGSTASHQAGHFATTCSTLRPSISMSSAVTRTTSRPASARASSWSTAVPRRISHGPPPESPGVQTDPPQRPVEPVQGECVWQGTRD